MGWKCAPQVMGLVRGEPKEGQKHRANIRKIAMEAGYERASRSDTLDRRRSHLNQYTGFRSGVEFSDTMEEEAAAYRMQVAGKTKDGQDIIRERGLQHNAVIGWAVIYNPPADTCIGWSDQMYEKFYNDCRDCMAQIEPRIFRRQNIRMSAEHYDEGVPPEDIHNISSIDRHLHDLGVCRDEDGRYCGNLIDAKLMIRINALFPGMMRERGWGDMEDLDTTDFERAKDDKEYAAERNAKRRKSGLAVNRHLSAKSRNMAEELAKVQELLSQRELAILAREEEQQRLIALGRRKAAELEAELQGSEQSAQKGRRLPDISF